MNKTNKPRDRQNSQFKQKKTSDAESILFGGDEIEVLVEQLEYFKLEILYKNQRIQELEQELMQTNQELCEALHSEQLSFDEAKEFAKVLLEKNLPVHETLALMLTSIYGSVVKPWQLLRMRRAAIKHSQSERMNLDRFDAETKALMVKSRELISGLTSFKEQLAQLKDRCKQLKVNTHRHQQLYTDKNLPILNEDPEEKGEKERVAREDFGRITQESLEKTKECLPPSAKQVFQSKQFHRPTKQRPKKSPI